MFIFLKFANFPGSQRENREFCALAVVKCFPNTLGISHCCTKHASFFFSFLSYFCSLLTLKPTSLETLDPQRAKFYSTAETILCPVPPHPRTSRGCPSPWRRLGRTQCRMRSFCSSAGRNTS